MSDEALAIVHIVRPRPPWRAAKYELTECGLSAHEHAAISREEHAARLHKWGRQRTAMHTCMTCMPTWERYGGDSERAATWEQNPVAALAREAEKARWARRGKESRERLDVELRAIMQLVADHHDEFDAIVARFEWLAQAEKDRQVRQTAKRARRK